MGAGLPILGGGFGISMPMAADEDPSTPSTARHGGLKRQLDGARPAFLADHEIHGGVESTRSADMAESRTLYGRLVKGGTPRCGVIYLEVGYLRERRMRWTTRSGRKRPGGQRAARIVKQTMANSLSSCTERALTPRISI